MKNHSVRFLSMLLVIALLIGLSPTSGLAATPTAETLKATNVTTSSAKLGGYVTANGGYEYAGYGFEICEVDSGDHWTVGWVSDNIDSNVNYYYTVTGLEMGTEYEYYFYAVSSSSEIGYDGTVYSNPKTFTTDCDHEYSEWVIDYEYNEEDYAEHSYREKIAYTCEHCDDYYTEWTDYTYEKHNWSTGKGYSECDDCQCELPQIEIYAFSVDDEYSVGETFSFFGSLSGEGSAIKRVAINVKKPGEKSYEHYRKTVDATTFSLTKVDDFEIDKEGEYYIYIWAVDAAENGLNSASAVKDAGTFVYSFTAGEGCSHNDWDYEYGDYEYSDIEDPEVHEYKIYYKKVCADCGKTIETGLTTPEEETHSFNNDGICKKCGYENVTSAEEIILTSSRTEVTGSGKVEFTTIGDYNSLRIFVKDNATGNVYDYTMTKNGTTFTYEHNFVGVGRKTVWAESGNGTESNKITITVLEAVEKLATPVYIGSTTTTTKEVFIFEWSDVTNAEGYTVFIYNRGAVSDYTNAIADRHVICGFSEAGEATIQICAVADGYTTSDPCNVTITITDPSEDIILTSSSTEVTGSGKVEFTTTNNYDSLTIFVKDNASGNVYDYTMTKNGATFTYEHNFVGVGTKTVWAESANGTESNKITITVLEAVEKLATPVYCGETTAVVGEAITFKWDSVANATGYSLWLYDSDVGIDLSNRITDEQAEYTFTEAGEYSVQIYANARGYTSSDSCNVTITVSAATLEPEQLASPNIVLSSYRLKVGDKLTVTWNEIENADYYSVVILDCENGNQVLQSATIYSGTNWTSSAITYAGTLFEVIVYACSDTPEQYLWSLPSIMPIEVYELDSWLEQLAPPVISLSSTTLKVGERLTVTWNEIENADYYTAIIWDDEVTEKDRLGFDQTAVQRADIMSGTSWTSGAMTYAGDYFSVGVFARSDIYDMSGAVTERFRVIDAASEPEQLASPVISLSSTTLKVGEKLTVTWNDVENADYYTVVIWDMNKPVSGGHHEVQREDIKSGTSWTSSEMTYTGDNFMINVYARSDNHEQYPQSEEKAGYFTVVESDIEEISISTPVLSVSSQNITVGNTIDLSWNDVDGAEQYKILVFDSKGNALRPEGDVFAASVHQHELSFQWCGTYNIELYALSGISQSYPAIVTVTVNHIWGASDTSISGSGDWKVCTVNKDRYCLYQASVKYYKKCTVCETLSDANQYDVVLYTEAEASKSSHKYYVEDQITTYKCCDEAEHVLISTISKRCSGCGRKLTEVVENENREAHEYKNGICTAVGCGFKFENLIGECEFDIVADYYLASEPSSKNLYISHTNSAAKIGLKDKQSGALFSTSEASNVYRVVLAKRATDETLKDIGLSFTNDSISVSESERETCLIGELSLINISTGKVADTVSVWYINTFRDGWFNMNRYTSNIAQLEQIETATEEHGYGIMMDNDIELFGVFHEYHNNKKNEYPNGYYVVTFEVINKRYVNYGVVVYDGLDNQVGETTIIRAYSPTTPFCHVMWEGGKAVLYTLGALDPERGLREKDSQITKVSVEVPVGGYICFETSENNETVEDMNDVDIILTLLEHGETAIELLSREPGSIVDNSYISKEVFLGYLKKTSITDVIKEVIKEFNKSGLEGAFEILQKADCFEDLKEAYKNSMFTIDNATGIITAIFGTVEKNISFLHPVAFYAEHSTNLAQSSAVLMQLSSTSQSGDDFYIDCILVPATITRNHGGGGKVFGERDRK